VAKRGRPKSKMQLSISADPGVCRFGSLSEAISASTDILAHLIRQGDSQRRLMDAAAAPQDEQTLIGGD